MITRKLHDGDIALLTRFLRPHTEASMILLSNIRSSGLQFEQRPFHGDYFGAFDPDGSLCGVLAHYWNGNLLMQAPDPDALTGLCRRLAGGTARPVTGVVGPDQQALAAIAELGLHGAEYATNHVETVFSMELATGFRPAAFDTKRLRMVEAAELDRAVLSEWLRAYDIETQGKMPNEMLEKRISERTRRMGRSGGDCWALLADGTPVSLCGINARMPDAVQIGPVWTPPQHRGRGFAGALISLVLTQARNQGVERAVLFTENPSAVRIYRAIGFGDCGQIRLALFHRPFDIAI